MGAEMNKVTVVNGDDWQGLYLNGVLHSEAHSLKFCDLGYIINKIGPISKYVEYDVCSQWMYDMGFLPKFFVDIPKDVLQ